MNYELCIMYLFIVDEMNEKIGDIKYLNNMIIYHSLCNMFTWK